MLSILIPTYNYNIFPLVTILNREALTLGIDFEITCLDDGSKEFHFENNEINSLNNCTYTILKKNIGRSAIRNSLAKNAKFENLLFLDADVMPIDETFISNYLQYIRYDYEVIYGGILYQKSKPKLNERLRWTYGISRESLDANQRNQNNYISFLTLNFLIKKVVFKTVNFNESIPNLRHEDTLFSFNLKQNQIPVKHIDNPVYHLGLESSTIFLKKSEESLIGLKYLVNNNLINKNYVRLSTVYCKLKKTRLHTIFLFLFNKIEFLVIKQITGKNPSLFLFDLYRLAYYIQINSKKNA